MNQFNPDRRAFAPDQPGAAPRAGQGTAALRDAYLDKLTDPANGYSLAAAFPPPTDLPGLYAQLTELKLCLDSFRPFDPAQVEKLDETFDTEYTFNSNRIEGNTLTLNETHLIINKGITVAGKSLKEHLEATNHQEAIDFIRDLAAGTQDFTQFDLKQVHGLVLHAIDRANAGVYRNVGVSVGQHIAPDALQVPGLMDALFQYYDANKATIHPVELAAQFHERFVTVHPFVDGNGRTARLAMNLILLRNGYPITVINSDNATVIEYFDALAEAQASPGADNSRFLRLVADNVRRWLLRYLSLVSVDVSLEGKTKGDYFFQAISPSLSPRST